MNEMNCTFTKAFEEHFFGVGLNGSLCNFIYSWLGHEWLDYDKEPNRPKTPTTVPLLRRP